MEKVLRSVAVITLSVTMLFNNLLITDAKENEVEKVHVEAVYDLEEAGKKVYTIYEEDGTLGLITIEKLNSEMRLSNGDYQVTYSSTGAWRAGFRVTISNNKIEKVFSPSYVVIVGKISGTTLKKVSTTKATYSFLYTIGGLPISTGVKAIISNGQLVVSKI